MKTLKAYLVFLLNFSAFSFAASNNPVLLQNFYWEVPIQTKSGSWWQYLSEQAEYLEGIGIDAVWLPPPYKGATGILDSGYGVYDWYDLGEFEQKGSVRTRYGTLLELKNAITSFHKHHIQVYADIAMNHLIGADSKETFTFQNQTYDTWTRFDYLARGGKYSTFRWNFSSFSGCKEEKWKLWNTSWDFEPSPLGWDNLMGCEVRYQNRENRNEMIAWGKWITNILNLDGYRLDATKHIRNDFLIEWLNEVKENRFAVSEAWLGGLSDLRDYLNLIEHSSSVFDFPLLYVFREVLNQNGNGDMQRLKFAGLTEVEGNHSVSFVENHDTARSNPQTNHKLLAYAYILMRDKGYPCVFYSDLFDPTYQESLERLLRIRKRYAWGNSWEHIETDSNVYLYSRFGTKDHPGLLLVLNDNEQTKKKVKTVFHKQILIDATGNEVQEIITDHDGYATLPVPAHSYSVWVLKE